MHTHVLAEVIVPAEVLATLLVRALVRWMTKAESATGRRNTRGRRDGVTHAFRSCGCCERDVSGARRAGRAYCTHRPCTCSLAWSGADVRICSRGNKTFNNTLSSTSSSSDAVGTWRPRLFFVRLGTGTGGGTRGRCTRGDSERAATLLDADDVLRRGRKVSLPSGW